LYAPLFRDYAGKSVCVLDTPRPITNYRLFWNFAEFKCTCGFATSSSAGFKRHTTWGKGRAFPI
jgi:hypothetical protein